LSPFAPFVTLAAVMPFLSVMVMVQPPSVWVTVAVGLKPSVPSAPSKSPRSAAAIRFSLAVFANVAAAFAAVAASVVISVACSYAFIASMNSVNPSSDSSPPITTGSMQIVNTRELM
jgi:hypothetical protein